MVITSKYRGPGYVPCYIRRSINPNLLLGNTIVLDAIADKLPKVADHVEAAGPDLLC